MADAASGMTTWGYATSAAIAIVALLAPVLGVFGDFKCMRKKLFSIFMPVSYTHLLPMLHVLCYTLAHEG